MANSKRKAHCNKEQYRTLLSAQQAAQRTSSQKMVKGDPILLPLVGYKCPYCDKYHVGRDRHHGIDWKTFEAVEKRLREQRGKYND